MAFCARTHGPLHAAYPCRSIRGHALFAAGCLCGFALAALRLVGRHLEGAKILEPEVENWRTKLYRRIMTPLIRSPRNRILFFIGVAILLVASMALVPWDWCA